MGRKKKVHEVLVDGNYLRSSRPGRIIQVPLINSELEEVISLQESISHRSVVKENSG